MSDTTNPADDALARSITAALGERVGAVDVPADAWTRIEAGRDGGPRGPAGKSWARAGLPMLAVAATTVLLIGVAAALRPPSSVETMVGGGGPSTTVPPGLVTVPSSVATVASTVPAPPGPTTTAAPTTTAPPPRTWANVDLASLTLPTAACVEGYRMAGETFTLVDGKAGVQPSDRGPARLGAGVELLGPVAFGDLDGDGHDEAVIRILCGLSHSDGLSNSVVVLRLVDGVPTVAALLPDSGTEATVDVRRPIDDRGPVTVVQEPANYDSAGAVAVEDGLLRVEWSQFRLGNPGFTVTVRYRVADGRASIVGSPDRVANPGPRAADDVAPYEIRSKDLRSMLLPTGGGGLCGEHLAPLGPLRDTRLVGGTADLVGADGQPVDGAISIVDIRYGNVADRDAAFGLIGWHEEAIIRFACRRGSETIVVPAVAELAHGDPWILSDLSWFRPASGASATDARAVIGAVVVSWADGSVTAYRGNAAGGFSAVAVPS